MDSARVLLVDDEKDFRETLSDRMEARGMQVDCAENGVMALGMIKDRKYDAIVLDLAMPEMDGIETLKRMLAEQPNLQIIMLTGHGSVKDGVEAVKAGAVDFLEKPADIDSLEKKIHDAQVETLQRFEKDLDDKISQLIKRKGW